jgi:DNA repair protein RadA/Sms
VPDDLVAIGEVGLTGEIRSVSNISRRISELQKLGFKQCMLPKSNMKELAEFKGDMTLLPVRNVIEALAIIR